MLELVIPGLILVFFGVGAWITAAVLLVFDIPLSYQLLIFTLTSVSSLLMLRQSIQKKYMDVSIGSLGESPDNGFIGSKAVSLTAISPSQNGKVEFNGSQWEACSDQTIGPRMTVKIVGMESIKLIVEPLNLS